MSAQTHIGVHPNEKTTMNKNINTIPAFDLAAFPKELSRPVTTAKITTIALVESSKIFRRP